MTIHNVSSFIYVSRSTVEPDDLAHELTSIVQTSLSRNSNNSVTGCLIHADGYFAQYLEGPEAALAELLARIEADERHTQVRVTDRRYQPARNFHGWAMAYSGEAGHLRSFLNRLHLTGGSEPDADRLIYMLQQFTGRATD